MKYFEIHYLKDGQRDKITLPYANKIEAINSFKQKKNSVFVHIQEVPEPISFKIKRYGLKIKNIAKSKNVPLEPYIASLRQLAVMLNAGLPITMCFQDTISAIDEKRLKEIFTTVLREVEAGASLFESFKIFEEEVGVISIAMFDLGEKTGMLDNSIDKLADILQEILDNRMRLKKATRYPIIVIVAMMIAFAIVITLVVPEFKSIFDEYKTALPFPTLVLIWIENTITQYGLYLLSGAIIVSTSLSLLYKKSDIFKLLFDKYMLKFYIVGDIIYLSMVGRFIYVFNKLSASGLPIVDSLKTAISIVENVYLKEQLNKIVGAIEEGRGLKDGFKRSELFENMVIQMVSAGESSGAMSAMLEKISIIYKKKYSYLVDNVATMIEPLLIAGIAGFVLLLSLGIFLPMWSLVEAVGN